MPNLPIMTLPIIQYVRAKKHYGRKYDFLTIICEGLNKNNYLRVSALISCREMSAIFTLTYKKNYPTFL